MNEIDVSLIVTTYQMPEHLARVLASAARQTVAERMELVISDDGSTDATAQVAADFARQAPFPVRFCTLPHDGFRLARTRNEGVRHARGKHLVFLDGDCLIEPDHVAQHLRHGGPGIVTNTYCIRLDRERSEAITTADAARGAFVRAAPASQRRALAWMQCKAWFYGLIRHPTRPALRGGNVGITKADYLRINGYDEQFCGWGAEDDDAGRRMRRAGMKIRYLLHRTRTYHLWHPPAPSKPQAYRDLGNLALLKRPLRLTRCAQGVVARAPGDLSVRLLGEPDDEPACTQFLMQAGWRVAVTPRAQFDRQRCDLELLAFPGHGRFSGAADVRIALVTAAAARSDPRLEAADVVVSPQASVGDAMQLRLTPDHLTPLYQQLGLGVVSATKLQAA